MDKEIKEEFKELGKGINEIKIEQASFKSEVVAKLNQGHERFKEIKDDINDIKDTLHEVTITNAEQEIRINQNTRGVSKLKNNKWSDRLTAGGFGGGGGLIITTIKSLFGIGE